MAAARQPWLDDILIQCRVYFSRELWVGLAPVSPTAPPETAAAAARVKSVRRDFGHVRSRKKRERPQERERPLFFSFFSFYPFFPGKTWLSLFLLLAPGTMEKFARDHGSVLYTTGAVDSLRLQVLQTCSCPSHRLKQTIGEFLHPFPLPSCLSHSLSSRKSTLGPGGGFARTDAGATPLSAPPRANAVTVSRRLFYSIAAGNSCCDGRGDCPASGVCVHVVADRPTWIYADSPITRARASFCRGTIC